MNRLFRYWRPVLAVFAVWLAVTPALAQSENDSWSAYVYSQAQQTLVRVTTDGEQTPYALNLGNSVALQGRHMAFWPDGDRVAFCAIHYGATNSSTLTVRDLPSGEDLVSLPFENASDCRVTQAGLSDDQRKLAVALFNYFPGDTEADTRLPSWQYVVVDTATGDILHELNAHDAPVTEAGIAPNRATIAEAFEFSGDVLTFYAIPYAVGGSNFYPTYRWTLSDGSLALADEQATYNGATLPELGERVYATQDTSLPFGIPNGPVPSNNIVLASRADEAPYPVYHTPDWIVVDADYIENGQRIAVTLYPPADQPQTTAFAVSLRAVAVDRQGEVEDLLTTDGNMQIAGAPGGYIALLGTTDPTGPYRLMYASAGQMKPLWQASGDSWELAWAAPTAAPATLPPFEAMSGE